MANSFDLDWYLDIRICSLYLIVFRSESEHRLFRLETPLVHHPPFFILPSEKLLTPKIFTFNPKEFSYHKRQAGDLAISPPVCRLSITIGPRTECIIANTDEGVTVGDVLAVIYSIKWAINSPFECLIANFTRETCYNIGPHLTYKMWLDPEPEVFKGYVGLSLDSFGHYQFVLLFFFSFFL